MATRSIRARTTFLTDAQRVMLQDMLDEQRRFRIEQIEQLTEATGPQARTEADIEVQETILRGARIALGEVESALQRMADGRYGRCEHCGTALPLERLEVLPHATLCMPCQSDVDHMG